CLAVLVLLKTFRRLGYTLPLAKISPVIVDHIATVTGLEITDPNWTQYDQSKTRIRHLALVRNYWNIKSYRHQGQAVMREALTDAAQTKHDLVDLINIAIQTLSDKRIELPGFTTLERAARQARHEVTTQCYKTLVQALSLSDQVRLQSLFVQLTQTAITGWERLKQEPGKPMLSKLHQWIERYEWLRSFPLPQTVLIPCPVLRCSISLQRLKVSM
ncbi:MAG: DUF4158 domain-containing protein, partial [Cyanobacteria bacterium J06642_11]